MLTVGSLPCWLQWTSLAWGFRVVMGFSGVAMVCMVIGWRVAKAEYEAHQKEAGNGAPVKALEMVPPEVSGLAAVEAGAAGAGAGAGAGSSSVGGASGASSRRPTRRLSGSTTSTFASDLPCVPPCCSVVRCAFTMFVGTQLA